MSSTAASHITTPSRERSLPLSSSQQSSTLKISTNSPSPKAPNQPITVEALLAAHKNAPSPQLAALEQAVNERNSLSSQNTQLWKLIEKQRTGYTQIMKELERVRSERDAHKGKLMALGQLGSSEKDRRRAGDKEKSLKHSHSIPISISDLSSVASNDGSNSEPKLARGPHHQIHASRSQEPILTQPRNSSLPPSSQSTPTLAVAPNNSSPSVRSFSTPNTRLQKMTPPPLLVPPRSESLPSAPSSMTTLTDGPRHGKSESLHDAQNDVHPSPQAIVSAPIVRPLTFTPRKTNAGSNANAGNSAVVDTPTQPPQPLSQSPLQNAVFDSTRDGPGMPPSASQSHANVTPTLLTLPPPQSPISIPTLILPSVPSQSPHSTRTPLPSVNNLSGDQPHSNRPALSRESRISLPDEAKQFIANMQDITPPGTLVSNTPTPGASSSQPQTPVQTHGQNWPSDPVHSHMQSQQYQSPGQIQPQSHAQAYAQQTRSQGLTMPLRESRPNPEFSARPTKVVPPSNAEMAHVLRAGPSDSPRNDNLKLRRGPEEFLDLEDDDTVEDDYEDWRQEGGKHSRGGAAVEDFPLPPSNAPGHDLSSAQAQVHLQVMAAQRELAASGSKSAHSVMDLNADTLILPRGPTESKLISSFFRALPLLSSDLPYTHIQVSHSSIKPNDRGRDVLSFIVAVDPGHGKEGWKVEKLYSDVLGLDQRVRASVGKGVGKKIASLPEGKLWRDHAPAKVDQRKAALEAYLQNLINLPVRNKDEVIAFFTSDIVREAKKPVAQVGYKEGYLTKRGKNFGGWKTRFFVLQGPVLEYYESRGGTHLGSILITDSQIGRQQSSSAADDEKEYRHAFLVVEAKKGPGGSHPRHVLCAESDADRDSWVELLVRYVTGTYSDEPILALGPSPISTSEHSGPSAPRSSTSSVAPHDNVNPSSNRRPAVRPSREDTIKGLNGSAVSPITFADEHGESSPARSMDSSRVDKQGLVGFSDAQVARKILEKGQSHNHPDAPLSSSLPTSSPLDNANGSLAPIGQRANSELGYYPDMSGYGRHQRDHSPEHHRRRDHHGDSKAFQPTLNVVSSSPTSGIPNSSELRAPSPEKVDVNGKAKISGPIGGTPIPAGYKFGGKDAILDPSATGAANERREKTKSRLFRAFGRPNGGLEKAAVTSANRAVFGIPLEESLDVIQIASLPAVVFRCIQYLETKRADQEEGIYRMNGSSAVIKSLKDRFNMEGDVDLLGSDEYWDPHAIAGLLKTFLRELPASILTRELHLKFLSVIDFVDPQERIKELSQLIALLPIANYSLLRALTAHLILIVQNAGVNKMTMRNVGIVFSPTLGIPAGVFSLMLGEFNRVFNVDPELYTPGEADASPPGGLNRRNSRQYSDTAADQLLGLSGRTLAVAPVEEVPSDGDDYSVQDESGTETTEGEGTFESSGRSSPGVGQMIVTGDSSSALQSRASHVAATRGLSVNISDRGNRHSKVIGLPTSPRPADRSPLSSGSPMPTARQ